MIQLTGSCKEWFNIQAFLYRLINWDHIPSEPVMPYLYGWFHSVSSHFLNLDVCSRLDRHGYSNVGAARRRNSANEVNMEFSTGCNKVSREAWHVKAERVELMLSGSGLSWAPSSLRKRRPNT